MSNGGSITSFLRNLHTIFHIGCGNLQFHQECMSVAFLPHLHQHLLMVGFLITAILTGIRWNLRVVFICILLIARDSEHFFMYLLTDHISSFEKCLFSSLDHWLIALLVCWLVFVLSFLNSLYILEFNAVCEMQLAKIFCQFIGSLFSLLFSLLRRSFSV